MVQLRRGLAVALLVGALVSSSFGVAGIGIHWGNDFSLHMDNVNKEWVAFDDLAIGPEGIEGTLPDELAVAISGRDLPIYISRTTWTNTRINGGLKIYVDVIPVLDALELSTNFGLWEYDGSITYPTGLKVRDDFTTYSSGLEPDSIFEPEYETVPLTLEQYGFGLMGLRKTPYMKLQFDLTIRKYLAQLPPIVKILKIYAGGGLSLNFATPVLSKDLVEDALAEVGESLGDIGSLNQLSLFSQDEIVQAVVEQIYKHLMTPHFGMHIDLGVMVKIPIVPVGIYVDGKFLIPFGAMDEYVDIGGLGLLLNSGISFSF